MPPNVAKICNVKLLSSKDFTESSIVLIKGKIFELFWLKICFYRKEGLLCKSQFNFVSLSIRNSNKAILWIDLTLAGTTRSQFNAAPPIYPFTIPPEGEQESQGYHSEQGGDGYSEVCLQLMLLCTETQRSFWVVDIGTRGHNGCVLFGLGIVSNPFVFPVCTLADWLI